MSAAESASSAASSSAVRWVCWKPSRAGAGIGVARVQHDPDQLAALDDLLRPYHRCSLDAVAGEDAGGGTKRSVVDHQRDVAAATRLDARGNACCPKALRRGHAHGATPAIGSAVSRQGQVRCLRSASPARPHPSSGCRAPTRRRPGQRARRARLGGAPSSTRASHPSAATGPPAAGARTARRHTPPRRRPAGRTAAVPGYGLRGAGGQECRVAWVREQA